jgi:ABC-type phosphate transport system auxiliary subunit
MANQPDITDFVGAVSGLITGVIASLIAFKSNGQKAEKQFREDLLQLVNMHSSRIEALEEENRQLRERNQDLIIINQREIQKQTELTAKVSELEIEKSQMSKRIDYLENRLREVSDSLERMYNDRRK